MKSSYQELPQGFVEKEKIDLKADKKLFLLVNISALIIGLILGVGMHFIVPIQTIFSLDGGPLRFFLRFGVLLVGSLLYIVLHELTHAIAMKAFGTKKVKFGVSATYAYAGSDDYYAKNPYLIIALAPVVVFAVILGVLQFLVPTDFFWVIWWIQISNLSGAAGDFYVTARFCRLPKDVLIRDYGVGMSVFAYDPQQLTEASASPCDNSAANAERESSSRDFVGSAEAATPSCDASSASDIENAE